MFCRALEAARSLRGRKGSAVRPAESEGEGKFSSLVPRADVERGRRPGSEARPRPALAHISEAKVCRSEAKARVELSDSEASCRSKPGRTATDDIASAPVWRCRSSDEGMPLWYALASDEAKARIARRDSQARAAGGQPRACSAAVSGASTASGGDERWAKVSNDEGMPQWYQRAREEAMARIELRKKSKSRGARPRS